jgi:hypothetical protein
MNTLFSGLTGSMCWAKKPCKPTGTVEEGSTCVDLKFGRAEVPQQPLGSSGMSGGGVHGHFHILLGGKQDRQSWTVEDQFGLMQQIGAIPEPG